MFLTVDKIGIEISACLCYNTHTMQDSYIGNTTASQAVKAGSTPVSCSMKKAAHRAVFFMERDTERVEQNEMRYASGMPQQTVKKVS